MLSVFRRIRKGLVEPSQVRRYSFYAIGEIALVVIGILIALQINNWNQTRKDQTKGEKLLIEIISEMELNKVLLEKVLAEQSKTVTRLEELLKYFHGFDKSRSSDSLYLVLSGMLSTWTYNPSLGVIESIISSGDIRLISNRRLSSLISGYKDKAIDANESIEWGIEETRVLESMISEYVPIPDIWMGVPYFQSLGTLEKSAFPSNLEGLFADQIIESSISLKLIHWKNGITEEEQLLEMIIEILDIADKELR